MPLKSMELLVPADVEYALAVGLAVDGLGMKAGLDLELLADLRALCTECLDTLSHRPFPAEQVRVTASLGDGRLQLRFTALEPEHAVETASANQNSLEITRGILETLMPDVTIESDHGCIRSIRCSMPV